MADPLGVAAELADAVEQGRPAEPEDAGFALTLAAEIAEVRARLDAALQYADRAAAAYPSEDAEGSGFARALRARILFRVGGRQDDAMAAVTALRPLLTEQPDAPAYVSAALDAGGRTATAEEWFIPVLARLRVARAGGLRPRTRPDTVLADKAYTSKANRAYLCRRGITGCIPSKADQDAHRKAKGVQRRATTRFRPRRLPFLRWRGLSGNRCQVWVPTSRPVAAQASGSRHSAIRRCCSRAAPRRRRFGFGQDRRRPASNMDGCP